MDVTDEQLLAASETGTEPALIASVAADRPAIISPHGERTYGQLNARVNQIVRALRARGLVAGEAVALLCRNRPEFAEVLFATYRGGWRLTPLNWHLTTEELTYIVADCDARVLVADVAFADAAGAVRDRVDGLDACVSIGGGIPGFDELEQMSAEQSADDLDDPVLGHWMIYTSGTTGRPKGVEREPGGAGGYHLLAGLFGFSSDTDTALATAPLYHTGPIALCLTVPLVRGVPVVLMDAFDAEEVLRLIERHRVTHTYMVPTMFERLLGLPAEVRTRYDLSSLRFVVHGAAPVAVRTKQAMMDWFGPVLHELYAATEGMGTWITPEEWLAHPGSVGKVNPGQVVIRDADGQEQPPGEQGTVWIKAPDKGRFAYHKDEGKTGASYDGDYFTVGDIGHLDDEGYLYLSGRTAEVIISGGVNIYPAEIDGELLAHPAVADVATVGVPNAEWGEEVKAVVQLADGHEPNAELAEDIIAFAREVLAGYKVPRSVDFVDALPRSDAGKLYRRVLRERYRQASS